MSGLESQSSKIGGENNTKMKNRSTATLAYIPSPCLQTLMWNTRNQSNYGDKELLLTRFLRNLDKQVMMVVRDNGEQGREVVGDDGEQGRAATIALEKNKGLACQIW